MKKCPFCFKEWPDNCEQGICIIRHDECVVCRFTPKGCGSLSGTKAELASIAEESRRLALTTTPSTE
ncbi:MAG: hypothetical protein ACI9DH_000544 [Halioglobus sp.]|jgi:hypothetical protein